MDISFFAAGVQLAAEKWWVGLSWSLVSPGGGATFITFSLPGATYFQYNVMIITHETYVV